MKNPAVDILICTKNNKDIISKCLDSIKNQTYKNWKCIVLDDESTDGSCEFIEKKYPFVKCLRLKSAGPSKNRNIGMKLTCGKYIVTMDSDAILTKNWVSQMVEFMEKNPNVGLCAGKILFEDKHSIINIAGGGLTKPGIVYHRGVGKNKDEENYNKTIKTIYLCSASMILRRNILKTIGYFDEDYFYGHEDLDICWRANLAGFDVCYYPEAESYHEENGTVKKFPSAKSRFLGSRNRMLTLFKNYETKSLIKYSPLFLMHFIYLVLLKNNRMATINAYVWNIKNWDKIKKERAKVEKMRKRSDKELFKLF